jgi:GNAT superfamily N-acetyltransferase
MAAVTREAPVLVRSAHPDEGFTIAGLWRELWDAHEEWGGYAGTREARVYEQLAHRLSDDARVRNGHCVLGRHIHLVASTSAGVVGQVEGWFERHGLDFTTPITCEVRSLIVTRHARVRGAGRALLEGLAGIAKQLSRGAPVVLAAEVLEPNPAQNFYTTLGYVPVSWSARIATEDVAPPPSSSTPQYRARLAVAADALPVAMLDPALAARRRDQGDARFDRPRAIDATFIDALASHLGRPSTSDHVELVCIDQGGMVRATATLSVMSLDPPFLPARRGILSRFAMDPALDPRPLVATLVRLGRRLALVRGAATLELTDLGAPHGPIYEGAMLAGAAPWSRIVERLA